MIEEDSTKETKVDSIEGDRVSRAENTTPIIGKLMGVILGSSTKGGAIVPD